MRVGLNNDELKQLVAELRAGRTWEELEQELRLILAPGVLEASDYQAWATREAGVAAPAAAPEPELAPAAAEDELEPALSPGGDELRQGKRKRGRK